MTTETVSQLTWHEAIDSEDLDDGEMSVVTLQGQPILIVKFDGRFYAIDARCPHRGAPLVDGTLEDGAVHCPWHGEAYILASGENRDDARPGVQSYRVEIRDEYVQVAMDEPPPPIESTVSDRLAESMVASEIRWVFGKISEFNLGLASAIKPHADSGALSFINARHEAAASIMASAYGKLTGHPAACLGGAGSTAVSFLTGLWDARTDGAPVVAITGQVQSASAGRGAFQDIDDKAALGDIGIYRKVLTAQDDAFELGIQACRAAKRESGVAHLMLPADVQRAEAVPNDTAVAGPTPTHQGEITPPRESVAMALKRLSEAKKPAILIGPRARHAIGAIQGFAEMLGAPMVTTFDAKGVVSDKHPLACGVVGRRGTPSAAWYLEDNDVLLVLGARVGHDLGVSPSKSVIQIDPDPRNLAHYYAVSVPVWGDIGVTIGFLHKALDGRSGAQDRSKEIEQRKRKWISKKARRESRNRGRGVNSASIFASLTQFVPDNAIITVDAGNSAHSFGRYFECKGQVILMSAGLGLPGFASPAAIGAWAATQEEGSPYHGRPVVAISGDGGFAQYMGELATAVAHGIPLTQIVLSNGQHGQISQLQKDQGDDVWQTDLCNPNFAELSNSCGALGLQVAGIDQLDTAIKEAIAFNGPSLVEIFSDPELA